MAETTAQKRARIDAQYAAQERRRLWSLLATLSASEEGREMLAEALAGEYVLTPDGPVYAPKGSSRAADILAAAG